MADALDDVFPEPMEAAEDAPQQEPKAAVEPAPETVAEEPKPEQQPEAVQQPRDAGFVPLDAMLSEREKRQAVERELQQLRSQRAQPQDVPDAFDDPQGFAAYQTQQVQQMLFQERFATSEYLATEKYGSEDVKSAAEWAQGEAQRDPTFAQRFAAERFPMMWIVQQHKRNAMLSEIGDNVDDWFTREAAKRGYAPQSAPAPAAAQPVVTPQQASPPVKVPRSLATQGSGPSDIRQVATGPLAGVDAVFSA